MRIKTIETSNKNFILKCRDGKRTETRIGMEGCRMLRHTVRQHGSHLRGRGIAIDAAAGILLLTVVSRTQNAIFVTRKDT